MNSPCAMTLTASKGDGLQPAHKIAEAEGALTLGRNPPSPSPGRPPAQLLKRPAITIEQLLPGVAGPHAQRVPEFAPWLAALEAVRFTHTGKLPAWVRNEMKTVETSIKFAGYLAQQQRSMERLRRDEARIIPEWFDYTRVSGLSREMVEKLGRVRPSTLGQASRMAGVTPAAVSLIQCFLEIQARVGAGLDRTA